MKHIEDTFQGQRGLNLYCQCWLPDSDARAVLIIAHGIAEHCGRYHSTATHFASLGYALYSFDYRGHGRSEGQHGYVDNFSYFADDMATFHGKVASQNNGKKIFVLGHSMGVAVALLYASRNPENLAGLILSGAPFRSRPYIPPVLVAALYPLSVLVPRLGLYRVGSSTLSRDKNIVTSYDRDPLVFRGKLTARLALQFLWSLHQLENRMSRISAPTLIMHGAMDRLCSPEGSQIAYERIGSKDKTLKLYSGFYHEILNEPEHDQVWADIAAWLERRV